MYLYQIDNKLIVSETKRPKEPILNQEPQIDSHVDYVVTYEILKKNYNQALSEWQKNLIPVKEGEEEKFIELGAKIMGSFFGAIKQGIKLPDEAVRIEHDCEHCNRFGLCQPDCIDLKPFAYLNNQPKKEESNEAIEFGVQVFRNVQMSAKVELILKPKHMNDVFTWKQIQDAIMQDK